MAVKDNKFYLIHISECITDILDYISDGHDEFVKSKMMQDAVIRKLQIMAESTMRLSDEIKKLHPEVEWDDIRDFRNFVVHHYTRVDNNLVWDIVEEDIPPLKKAVDDLLANWQDSWNT